MTSKKKPVPTFEEQLTRALAHPAIKAKIRQLVDDELFVIDGIVSKGKVTKVNGRGPKAKGRAGCEAVKAALHQYFPFFADGDVFIKTTTAGGADLHLSDSALEKFNYAVEIKNSESLNIFKALKQAELNGSKVNRPYVVLFKRAGSPVFAALPAADFLHLAAFRADPLTMTGTV